METTTTTLEETTTTTGLVHVQVDGYGEPLQTTVDNFPTVMMVLLLVVIVLLTAQLITKVRK